MLNRQPKKPCKDRTWNLAAEYGPDHFAKKYGSEFLLNSIMTQAWAKRDERWFYWKSVEAFPLGKSWELVGEVNAAYRTMTIKPKNEG